MRGRSLTQRCCPSRRVLALGVIASSLISSAAGAQPADGRRVEAEALFEHASQLLDKHQYEEACPLFIKVVGLQPGKIGAVLALAECWEGAGKLASALARYQDVANLARAAGDRREK